MKNIIAILLICIAFTASAMKPNANEPRNSLDHFNQLTKITKPVQKLPETTNKDGTFDWPAQCNGLTCCKVVNGFEICWNYRNN